MNSTDLDRIAALHSENLPDSAISGLGRPYARVFYRYVENSEKELLFLHRDPDGRLDGACVVSLEPDSMEWRLLISTPLLIHALFHPLWLVKKILGVLFWRTDEKTREVLGKVQGLPELLIIYSDAARRDAGVGSDLIRAVESALVAKGITRYCVRTVNDPANRALDFYARRGFEAIGHVLGFRVFTRSLTRN